MVLYCLALVWMKKRKMIKNYLRAFAVSLVMVLSFTVFNLAQTAPGKNFPNIKIKNFGQMDERYYRGAQPKKDDFQALKALGINTVIDLRDDPTEYEKPAVEALGMKYINIPMGNGDYPEPEHIEQFLKIVNDPATGTFFVHCKGGKHRTGVTGAVYRFTKYGWDFEKAYREMKNYNFYTFWGYGDMKDFVEDYYEKLQVEKAQAKSSETQETTGSSETSLTQNQ